MRKIPCLLLLSLSLTPPALATNRVTVQQLELLLADDQGMPDNKVAAQIANLVLKERLSPARLARLQVGFPGRHCHDALTQLADEAAFLDPPDSDIFLSTPPDGKTQTAIVQRAVEYVNRTFSRLPNFFATRRTLHFEDTPARETVARVDSIPIGRGSRGAMLGSMGGVSSQSSAYVPLHPTARSTVTISYRDGYELVNSKRVDISTQVQSTEGLTTAGEFGPILTLVLGDALKSKLTWGYWEQGPEAAGADPNAPAAAGVPSPADAAQNSAGLLAVFRYWVPANQSSYLVAIPKGHQTDRFYPAYKGEIAIDPSSGDVLRITVLADLAPRYEKMSTAILVEYGPVLLGGTAYICPLRGVAFSRMPLDLPEPDSSAQVLSQMNEVTFTDYHLFRSESRMIPVETASPGPPPQ